MYSKSLCAKTVLLVFVLPLISFITNAGEIHSQTPSEVDPQASYVFYMHGFIVEGDNPKPVHPRWGEYDFPEIKTSLADLGDHLIAHHRIKGTDPIEFSQRLANDAQYLMDNGVAAKNISYIGFSRGGSIAILVSNLLKNIDINFAILAACSAQIENDQSLTLYGNVLSIREKSDNLVGSCEPIAQRSSNIVEFEEILISTNKEHGAFYRSRIEWLDPLKRWLANKKAS